MEKIKKIIIFNDGLINIHVECGICKNVNIHTISSVKNDDNISIDFTQLGKRYCDGIHDFRDPINTQCKNHYSLYP
tara:strand:+ start:5610 stop:5837 length:228 start_codon:yes stop_codon:yes gene_type:complete